MPAIEEIYPSVINNAGVVIFLGKRWGGKNISRPDSDLNDAD